MSIISNIRKSRQKAKDHNAKLEEQKQQESTAQSYRHVPTHAATDAIAAAPPSWREADRPKIMEQNRRRSAMAAAGHHMNIPGIPRVGSNLSHVSYPSGDSTPVVNLPRPYSFQGISPYSNRGREVVYSVPELSYSQPTSLKGKEVNRLQSWEGTTIFSREEPMVADSSGGSDSSQDDLEMKSARKPRSRPTSSHRFHPGHPGRTYDASTSNVAIPGSAQRSTDAGPRDSRPPPSTRGFSSILPPLQLPLPQFPGQAPPRSNSHDKANLASQPPIVVHNSRQSSAASLPSLSPASSKPGSAPTTPAAISMAQPDTHLKQLSEPESSSSEDGVRILHAQQQQPRSQLKTKDRRPHKTTRFVELERIDSNIEVPNLKNSHEIIITPVPQGEVVNAFPEMAADDGYELSGKSKAKNKSTKTGGRLTRKNRSGKT